MNEEALLVGIDLGSTNCKALVFDTRGRQQAAASLPTPIQQPRAGWAEYDPAALWQAVVTLLRQVLSQVDPGRVRGVAVASMAESGLLIDAAGQPLCPLIAWYDSRSDAQYRRWLEQYGPERFVASAGNRPNPVFSIFKLLWLRDEAPEAYAAAVQWLHVADYIIFRLCGVPATDYSLASRTMLLDLTQRRWSSELLDAAGLHASLMPKLIPAGTRIGGVSAAAAAETGLLEGIAVACGGHDHSCGALAAGAHVAGVALDSMGTAETAFMSLDALPPDLPSRQARCWFSAHVARDGYCSMKGIRSASASVAWAARLLGFAESTALGFPRMQAAAEQARPGSRGVMFLPRLAAIDRGAFVGLTADAGAPELARAVYEGLAYEWRSYLELIERVTERRAASIRLFGGGSQSAVWVQIKADVLGKTLRVLDLKESVALGAALLAGLAAGIYRDETEALAQLERSERLIVPDPQRAAFYERSYQDVYLKIAPALEEVNRGIVEWPMAL